MRSDHELRYRVHVFATLLRVREEIDAMERCGAAGDLLDETLRHATELIDILADSGADVRALRLRVRALR